MRSKLSLSFLGGFQVEWGDQAVSRFATNKVRALLAYLAVEAGRPHDRLVLATLLWPNLPERSALQNLRQTLSRLNKSLPVAPGEMSLLLTVQQEVSLNPALSCSLDVTDFQQLAVGATSELEAAAALYKGEFLAGFNLSDNELFEEWVILTREVLHRQALEVFYTLATYYEEQEVYEKAIHYARRQLALEPWREEAHQQLIRVFALSGQRGSALAQYEVCHHLLTSELGVQPSIETRSLYERIRTGELLPAVLSVPLPRHNLPSHATPFVDRDVVLGELSERLHQPDVRLLTLVGAGGMGKSRLAVEIARRHLEVFSDGVFFVPLAALSDDAALLPAIASAMGLTLHGDVYSALLRVLRDKHLLLILDNFEHLLGSVGELVDLLQAVPFVQVIVTSRERLNVRGEHLYVVQGMSHTDGIEGIDSPAVRLFAQSARWVQPRFQVDQSNLSVVLRICEVVEGMPLALELAAAWAEMLPLDTILAEIERSVDFLGHQWRDLPARQQSIRAVFDWSWRLLSDRERLLLRQLAFFRGSFTWEAAHKVVGASLRELTALVHKSLLHWSAGSRGSGRYKIHETVRQFALEHLNNCPDERSGVQERHSVFYLSFVAEREGRLLRHGLKQAAEEVCAELDNVQGAWVWAAQHARFKELESSAFALWHVYLMKGLFSEGERSMRLAAAAVQAMQGQGGGGGDPSEGGMTQGARLLLCRLLVHQASAFITLGRYDVALQVGQQAIEWSQIDADIQGELLGSVAVAEALIHKAHYAVAQGHLERVLQLLKQCRDAALDSAVVRLAESATYFWLGHIAFQQGNYVAARRLMRHSLAIGQRQGFVAIEMISLANLAEVAHKTGEFAVARQLGEQALAIARNLGFRWMEGVILLDLGELMRRLGNYSLAQLYGERAWPIVRELGAYREEVLVGVALLRLYSCLGDVGRAREWLGRLEGLLGEVESPAVELSARLAFAIHGYLMGDRKLALGSARQARQIASEVGSRLGEAEALVIMGHLQGPLYPAEATVLYQQAVEIYKELDHPLLAVEPQAALASLALLYKEESEACSQVEAILSVLAVDQHVGLDTPFYVYMQTYKVLEGLGDPRAVTLLVEARALLEEYASCITDETLRRSFLENISAHHFLAQAFSFSQSSG